MRAALALLAALAPTLAAAANDIALLYDPAPPADAAYVRFVNTGTVPVTIAGVDTQPVTLGTDASTRVSRYALVGGGRDQVDARITRAAQTRRTPLTLRRGGYSTVAVAADGSLARIDEAPSDFNQMKAQVAVYSFAAGCGAVSVALADRPEAVVFAAVDAGTVARRAVNPVAAELALACGGGTTRARLDGIAPGRRVSVIAFGRGDALHAVSTVDQTAPVPRR